MNFHRYDQRQDNQEYRADSGEQPRKKGWRGEIVFSGISRSQKHCSWQ